MVLLLAATLAAGCTTLGSPNRSLDSPVAEGINDGQMIADYVRMLDQLGGAKPAEQAELLQAIRNRYLAEPSTQHRLRYALVLAVPGHASSDPEGARALLDATLASAETLLPSERALAEVMVRELDDRLALAHENARLRGAGGLAEREQLADLTRRLQQESAEKERLRRELQQARAKLEAIATMEGGTVERQP
jgi:hypothetical protein